VITNCTVPPILQSYNQWLVCWDNASEKALARSVSLVLFSPYFHPFLVCSGSIHFGFHSFSASGLRSVNTSVISSVNDLRFVVARPGVVPAIPSKCSDFVELASPT